jgi:aryl-alcohol dehydrogenase-like predicted oxidoreductase
VQLRTLGKSGPTVSAIGLGCMRMTPLHFDGGSIEEKDGIATIEAALDAGVSLLNTGDFYSAGLNEMLVGKAIRGRRDAAFLSVKFGALRSTSGAFIGFDGRPAAVKNFCSYSLRRLGVDVIDLYQPARLDPDVPIEDTIGAIAELVQEGKVRFIGVSEYNAEQLRRAHATHPISALEIEYSLASRFIEDEILPTARELGVGIVAYGVVTQGMLTGTFPSELSSTDARTIFPRFQAENLKKNLEAAERLTEIARGKGVTPTQLAIAWVMAQGDDIVPIIGMSRPDRVPQNAAAADVALSKSELEHLNSIFHPGAIVGSRYPEQLAKLAAS